MEVFGDNKIDELEGKIEKLISSYRAAKDEKEKLINKIQTLETENQELKKRTEGTKGERELIVNKIMKILEKIDKAEA